MRFEIAQFEELIGYSFSTTELLRRALTHSSRAHEEPSDEVAVSLRHNEQFEFLGDSILGFIVSDMLVGRFPDWPEGSLHRLKAHLVSAAHLSGVAGRLDLGRFLAMGKGEERTGGRAKPAILVNALEALIAALYLDGGLEPARRFVRDWVIAQTLECPETTIPAAHYDYISELMILARGRKLPSPQFVVVEEKGPPHAKTFVMDVRLGRTSLGQGEGTSKKAASQKAAQEAIGALRAVQQ